MIVPDVNLLLYAVDEHGDLHEPAKAWLEGALSGTETIGFAWNVLLGFLRITTRPAAMQKPLTVEQALELTPPLWLGQARVKVIEPGPLPL